MTEPLDADLLKDLRGLGETMLTIKTSASASEST